MSADQGIFQMTAEGHRHRSQGNTAILGPIFFEPKSRQHEGWCARLHTHVAGFGEVNSISFGIDEAEAQRDYGRFISLLRQAGFQHVHACKSDAEADDLAARLWPSR